MSRILIKLIQFYRKNISPIRIAPHFKGIYGLGITISSKNTISIRGISIKYKNLI